MNKLGRTKVNLVMIMGYVFVAAILIFTGYCAIELKWCQQTNPPPVSVQTSTSSITIEDTGQGGGSIGGAKQPEPKPEPEKPAVPNLFGKTYNEVKSIIGREPDSTGHNTPEWGGDAYEWMRWTYNDYPFPTYTTVIHFEPYPPHASGASLKRVHWQVTSKTDWQTSGPPGWHNPAFENCVTVRSLVPERILQTRPIGIYIAPPNGIVVIWHIAQQTFYLGTGDSSRELYRTVKKTDQNGELKTTIELTEQAKEFRECDRAGLFGQIDSIPQVFGRKAVSFETPDYSMGSLEGVFRIYKSPHTF